MVDTRCPIPLQKIEEYWSGTVVLYRGQPGYLEAGVGITVDDDGFEYGDLSYSVRTGDGVIAKECTISEYTQVFDLWQPYFPDSGYVTDGESDFFLCHYKTHGYKRSLSESTYALVNQTCRGEDYRVAHLAHCRPVERSYLSAMLLLEHKDCEGVAIDDTFALQRKGKRTLLLCKDKPVGYIGGNYQIILHPAYSMIETLVRKIPEVFYVKSAA